MNKLRKVERNQSLMIIKRIVASFLSFALAISVLPTMSFAAESQGSLSNFKKVNTYSSSQFTDVINNSWYSGNVAKAYELDLMKGNSETTFNPSGNITIAETITLACRLHSIYYNDGKIFESTNPWYQAYVNYALEKGIIESKYENYLKPATRAEFASLLSKVFPDSELTKINNVVDGAIPDVPSNSKYYAAIYKLYRAGILTGNDSVGTFTPDSYITRDSVSTITTRMVDTSLRRSISLTSVWKGIVTWTYGGYEAVSPFREYECEYINGVATGKTRYTGKLHDFNTPIRINKISDPYINSAGGVTFSIRWNNRSEKDIKYIHFYVTPYNRVGDQQSCDITGCSTRDCYGTGPYKKITPTTDWSDEDYYIYSSYSSNDWDGFTTISNDGTYYTNGNYVSVSPEKYIDVFYQTEWDDTWYNDQIYSLSISKVIIDYMDGSRITLTHDALSACYY